VIERIFGVIKRKYKILNTPPEYSIDTQSDLILGITALHNFCRGLDGSKVDDYITELEGSCHGAGRDIALVKLDLAKLTSRDQPPVYKGLLPTTPFLSLAYSLSYND